MNAYEYYREMHPEITKDDYTSYVDKFRGSKQEEADLLKFYEDQKGDVRGLLENIIASRNKDIPRFIEFFEKQIKEGTLKTTKKFETSKNKVKHLADEEKDAEVELEKVDLAKKNKAGKQPKAGGMGDLESMILAKRENAFGGFLNYMEGKYGADKPNKKRKNPP